MEEWDIYTENREKTGRVHIRGEKMKEGEYHLVVTALIFNSEGKLLIQQRQAEKEGWPNFWDFSAAGSALKGENSQQAMAREVKEELGIIVDLSNSHLKFSWHFPNGFDDFWIIYQDVSLEEMTLQKEEVQNVRWVTQEEVNQLAAEGKMIPYFFLKDVCSWMHNKNLTL